MPPVTLGSSPDEGRRNFLTRLGSAGCALAALGTGKAVVDSLEPHALTRPTQFVVGSRKRITEGTILFDKEKQLIVVGAAQGVYAMSAICPHLGCMTRFQAQTGTIECACHGSSFNLEGETLSGPSRPLLWLEIRLNQRNELLVDTAVHVPAGTMLLA